MIVQEQQLSPELPDEEIDAAYKQAIERAIGRIPVKNGVVCIDSIWVETSLPYEILHRLLKRDDLILPANVERINTKSGVRGPEELQTAGSSGDAERRTPKRRKRRKAKSKPRAGD